MGREYCKLIDSCKNFCYIEKNSSSEDKNELKENLLKK